MKKPKRDSRVYLQDILSAIIRIEEYAKEGKEKFLADWKTQDAVIRQISVLGEAVAKLPAPLRAAYDNVSWKEIIGMRNIIIHDYSEINLERVWDTVDQDLTHLRKTVTIILKEQSA